MLIWNIFEIMGYNLFKICIYGDMFLRFIDKIKMFNWRGDNELIYYCCKSCNILGNIMIYGVKLIGIMVREVLLELRIKVLDIVCSIIKL